MKHPHPAVVVVVGASTALVAAMISLAFGAYRLPLPDVLHALGSLFGAGPEDATMRTLVLDLRLSRAVGALCVGAGLGTAGCMLQALLRNPLASPFVIGTAQAAGFGAVLAIFFRLPPSLVTVFAFVASLVAAGLVLSLSRTDRTLPTESVVLTGLAVSLLFGAAIGLVRFLAHDEGIIGRIAIWLMGGLWGVTWEPLRVLAPGVVLSVLLGCLLWRRVDLLALGASDARRLGLRVGATGTLVLLLTCVMTALAVCIGGVIAFVGLIVPHAARRLVGPGHAALLPASAFLGGIFLILTDTVARTAVPPEELPLGVVTSLIGVPAFLIILRSLRVHRREL